MALLFLQLHKQALKHFDDKPDEEFGNMKPLMRFRGVKNYIHCLAHALKLMDGPTAS